MMEKMERKVLKNLGGIVKMDNSGIYKETLSVSIDRWVISGQLYDAKLYIKNQNSSRKLSLTLDEILQLSTILNNNIDDIENIFNNQDEYLEKVEKEEKRILEEKKKEEEEKELQQFLELKAKYEKMQEKFQQKEEKVKVVKTKAKA